MGSFPHDAPPTKRSPMTTRPVRTVSSSWNSPIPSPRSSPSLFTKMGVHRGRQAQEQRNITVWRQGVP